jgi:hypothetical protein
MYCSVDCQTYVCGTTTESWPCKFYPLALLFLKLPFSIQNAFYRFLSSHITSWQKIFTHPEFNAFANHAISYLQGFLGAESCPTAIDLEP